MLAMDECRAFSINLAKIQEHVMKNVGTQQSSIGPHIHVCESQVMCLEQIILTVHSNVVNYPNCICGRIDVFHGPISLFYRADDSTLWYFWWEQSFEHIGQLGVGEDRYYMLGISIYNVQHEPLKLPHGVRLSGYVVNVTKSTPLMPFPRW